MYASYKQGRQPEAGGLSWSKFCTTPELLECKVTARSDSILFNLIKNFNEADQTNPMTIWLSSLHTVEPRGVAQHLFEDSRVLDRCGRELGVLCPLAGGYFWSNMSMFVEERALDGVCVGVVLNGLVIRHWLFPRYTSFLWAVSFIGLDMIKVYGVPASYTCATLAIWFLEADWGSVGLAPQQKWPRILGVRWCSRQGCWRHPRGEDAAGVKETLLVKSNLGLKIAPELMVERKKENGDGKGIETSPIL